MPLYDYECRECGEEKEILVLRKEWTPPECCGEDMKKKLTTASFTFARGGFSASSEPKKP